MSGGAPEPVAIEPIVYPAAFPTLRTERLLLREATEADTPAMRRWLSDFEIARNTGTIPHPYPPEAADEFLGRMRKGREEQKTLSWCIELLDPASATPWFGEPLPGYIGAVGFHDISADHRRAEMGYALAKPVWGRGIATEAALAITRYGFETLRLHRVYATHYLDNPASGAVLKKCGLRPEGLQPKHVLRFGTFRDVVMMGLLREDWEKIR